MTKRVKHVITGVCRNKKELRALMKLIAYAKKRVPELRAARLKREEGLK